MSQKEEKIEVSEPFPNLVFDVQLPDDFDEKLSNI